MKAPNIIVLAIMGVVALAIIVALVVINPFASKQVEAEASIMCQTGIEAGLTQGPDSPLDLTGTLNLTVMPDHSFTGTLTLKKDGSKVKVTGQGAGRGLDMVFDSGNGTLLFAHGSLENPIWDCKGYVGGALVGPRYGDIGDWTNRPPFIRVISGTNALKNSSDLY